jgi:pilus assembly protein Flp/PilA
VSDTSGTTAMEYALIGTIVSIIIVTAATSIGSSLNSKFTAMATGLR